MRSSLSSDQIYTSCQIIHFASYASVYEPIFTCDYPIFSNNISLHQILGQTTWRTWWKYIDTLCPRLSCSPCFLLVSIVLTVINTNSACFCDLRVGWINPGTFSAALTSRSSACSGSSSPLASSMLDSLSASQSGSTSFALSNTQSQSRQLSVFKRISGMLSSSPSAGCRTILQIRQTFNTWVPPPRTSCAKEAGGKGDLSDNVNAAAPSRWKFDQDALTISSVSEIYPTAVICMFWVRDSFCVELWFWLPCHISKKLWALAILCNVRSSVYRFISKSFPVFVESNARSSPANIPLFSLANCLTKNSSRWVSQLVFDCLQPMTSRPRDILASTPTPCGMIGNMSRATLERSAYFECVPSCLHQRCGISGIHNVLLMSVGLE